MRSAAGRIAYAVSLFVALALAACYDVPQPECGFQCGPPSVQGGEGTCPDGYVCFTNVDNRCHRVSPPFTEPCPGDAGIPVDLKPPLVVERSPAPDDTGVPLGPVGTVIVGFDEAVTGVDFPNFVVQEDGVIVSGLVTPLGTGGDNIVRYKFEIQSPNLRPFLSDTEYTVQLTQGITDFSGNELVPVMWSFRTEIDTTSPTATVQTPAMLAGVNVQTLIEVRFDEAVMGVNLASFTLTGPAGIVSANLTTNGTPTDFATLDPFSPLAPNTQYTIALGSSITDLAGNPLSFTPVTFTTSADTTSPMVSSTNPTNGSINVAVTANLSIGFSENVTNVSGATFSLTGPSGVVPSVVGSALASASLNPTHQLLPNTTYSYSLTSAIMDLAANPLIAFTGTFTTGIDNVPPSVIGRVPINGATNQPVTSTVVIDFDENVTNADATTIQLVAGTAVPAVVNYTGAPMFRATLTPSVQLAANTTYTVDIASTLQDASGNLFGTPPVAWTFTTGVDTVVPSIVSTSPADNTTDVPLDATISVTFDEPVVGVDATSFVVMNAGTGTFASSNGGRTWTFTPDAAMPANTNVTIMLTMAIEDAAGNDLVPFAFDFTTVP